MGQLVEVVPYEPPIGMTEVDSPTLLFDADSNRFDGIRVHDRNNGNINWYLITMTAPDGRALRAWEVRRPPWKLSNGTFFWSGNDLIVMLTGYELVPKPRPNGRDFTRIPGVFNAGRLMEEAGGAGGWAGNAEEETVNVDYDRIAREASDQTIAKLSRDDGIVELLVGNMKSKSAAAIREAEVLTTSNAQPHLAQFTKDRVYEAITENAGGEVFWSKVRAWVRGVTPVQPTPPPPIEPVEPTEPTEGGTP